MAWWPGGGTEIDGHRRRPPAGPAVDNGPPGAHTVGAGRRRALPSGRAVVGAFLIGAAAVVVFVAALAGASKPGQPWVVAARPAGPGTVLGPDDVGASTMRLSSETATGAYHQAASVEGRTLAVEVQAGELIQASMLVPVSQTPALRPVSLAVDPVSLAGLSAGQRVDILATEGTGAGTAVVVVVRGATLIDIASSSSNLLAPGGSGQVTVGVSTLAAVEAVVENAHSGTITLVAAEPSDGVGLGPGHASP